VAIFRLNEHMQRFHGSLKIYRTRLPYSTEELRVATCELLRRNDLGTCYIRPFAMRGMGDMGVYGLRNPLDVYIAAWEWGAYLGDNAAETGVDICISSWNRITPNSLPSISKAGGNYMNSQLVKMEAVENGYAEGLTLDSYGHVAEGSGENVFAVIDGVIVTPPAGHSLLPGITRNTVMMLAEQLGYRVEEHSMTRAMLYTADEIFLTGTAVEVTPVRSVDRIDIGRGGVGPITRAVQRAFGHIIVTGEDPFGWLTFIDEVPRPTSARRAASKRTKQ
jgi:branched-chain amino acid aminotransferase